MRSHRIRLVSVSAALVLGLIAEAGLADDWPTHQHDNARSGVTAEDLSAPLELSWAFRTPGTPVESWAPPQDKPVEGFMEWPRVRFDAAYHTAIVDGVIYFGSSADNKVYALDAGTGRIRWTFITGGPVRLAPTVAGGRVYVGADDGCMYCLDAQTGKLVWTFRGALGEEFALGRGRLGSLWPVRAGGVVDNGVVYFSAGVFPHERLCLYAVKAADGSLVWKTDTLSDERAGQSNTSLQGYMLASPDELYVPCGRAAPLAFDRATGGLKYSVPSGGRNFGGTYALLVGKKLYSGNSFVVGYDKTGRRRSAFAWFPGRRLVVTDRFAYMADSQAIMALDRTRYPAASRKHRQLESQQYRLRTSGRGFLYAKRRPIQAQARRHKGALADADRQLADLKKQGKEHTAAFKQATRKRLEAQKRVQAVDAQLADIKKQLDELNAQIQAFNADIKQAKAEIDACIPWRCETPCPEAMILAGKTLYAGGQGQVVAIDTATGKQVWRVDVDGKARGLAVSDGRLVVSTDSGMMYCFAKQGGASAEPLAAPVDPNAFPTDGLTPVMAAAADDIVRVAKVKRGFCVVLGAADGRLARELAVRTELTIHVIDPDPARVADARRRFNAAGLYGTRVCVATGDYARLPLPDYFANLIVSEDALLTGQAVGAADELLRVLKPHGGVVMIGQPAAAKGKAPALDVAAVRSWLRKGGMAEARTEAGVWALFVRGALPGADNWTHQYCTPANTASSLDQLVKAPLGVLWYGDPGPNKAVSRHAGAAAPLAVDGRVFHQGHNLVLCFDAYNGLPYWERKIDGARRVAMVRECSNLAADSKSLFVAAKDKCLRLDAATGRTLASYQAPKGADGKKRNWGYVARVDHMLYGSTTTRGRNSDSVFAIDLRTGKRVWTHKGAYIQHIAICIGGGRLYLTDQRVGKEEREAALAYKRAELKDADDQTAAAVRQYLRDSDVRLVTALDAVSGKTLWRRAVDLTNCGGGGGAVLTAMYHNDDLLVFCAAHWNGHYWPQFFSGEYARRSAAVLSAADGKLVWRRKLGYRIRPLIVGDYLYAEPWIFDVHTGEQVMREHPVTGQRSRWEFGRPGHHCGSISGCPSALFFRSWSLGYYDLLKDDGTQHFGGQRTGCWINMLPTQGLLVMPEASSGCVCNHAIHCTTVLRPRRRRTTWGLYDAVGPVTPVKHLAINLGAPGDRRDADGTLWLSYPRPPAKMLVRFDLKIANLRGGGYFRHDFERTRLAPTDRPWLYAFGCRHVRQIEVPVTSPIDGAAQYTVRLGFADLENTKPGQRVFHVKLQGKTVLKNFDIIKEAGRADKPVVREFRGVRIDDKLKIELSPAKPKATPAEGPIVSTIEIRRERVLTLGFATPKFVLNNGRTEQAGDVVIVNRRDEPFTGKLRVRAPVGFDVTPAETDVRVPANGRTTVKLTASAARRDQPARQAVTIQVVRTDGSIEVERKADIEHLANRDRMVLKVAEDAYTNAGAPKINHGKATSLLVDGGHAKLGDRSHNIAYLKFRLDVPGKPLRATLRLFVGDNPSGTAIRVCLVEGAWTEGKITYANRPKPGAELARIKRVTENTTVDLPLKVDLTGRKELSIVLDPLGCDGTHFYSKETRRPSELWVEYELDR